MAKIRAAGSTRNRSGPPKQGAIGCVAVIILGFLLLLLLIYAMFTAS